MRLLSIIILSFIIQPCTSKAKTDLRLIDHSNIASKSDSIKIHSENGNIYVVEGLNKYKYDFFLRNDNSINSYFVKSENNNFYVFYEYRGSINKVYILAQFTWINRITYLDNYVRFKNVTGSWNALVSHYKNYSISSFDHIEKTTDDSWAIEITKGKNAIFKIPVFLDEKYGSEIDFPRDLH